MKEMDEVARRHYEKMRRWRNNDPLGDFMAMFPFILVFIGVPIWIGWMIVQCL